MTGDGAGLLDEPLGHVLVVAPYRRDSSYISQLLGEQQIEVSIVDEASLAERLDWSTSALVVTHEALSDQVIDTVAQHLENQPAWSEMPIVVLLDRSSPSDRIRASLGTSWPRSRLLFYQRPVSAIELLSGVQSALLMRTRQREVGNYVEREVELRRELNHRVKNILASVTSIFHMAFRGSDSLEDLKTDFSGRLRALTEVHGAVFEAAAKPVPISEIVELTFAPYRVQKRDRIIPKGPEIMLTHEAATTLALCLHELATNAIKYGALSVPDGQVHFEWDIAGDNMNMRWQERSGPPVKKPEKSGYGTGYIKSAMSSLLGVPPKIEFPSEGLRFEITGPVDRIRRN